ncbi:hypothetical protein GCM10010171_53580 [Actinokineospora fastidiosa]|uniref:F5/8 type C domain-containing protein n=2 Tax=Actinokineospora fastidiosa TaxID=1816 RepID=A0A918LHI4_9PSEU|nr:hypothetical protein GCM10010171_53580 [Actinokineospora fastidiosa]
MQIGAAQVGVVQAGAAQGGAGQLGAVEGVRVAAALGELWAAYRRGDRELARLAARVDQVVRVELGERGEAVRAAVRLVVGPPGRAWGARLALMGVEVPEGQGAFVRAAVRAYDSAYAVSPSTVSSTFGHHGDHIPDRMADGDPGTYYWSAGPAVKGAAVVVDLGRVRRVHGVRLALGKSDRPNDYLHRGVLEFSVDGRHWYTVARLDGPLHEVRVRADIRYLRLRSTADQAQWLVVRDLSVIGCPVGKAADGDPATVFTVTAAPVELPLTPGPTASAIVVRAGADTARGGKVQVRMGGGWRTVGALAGPYTELPLPRGRATRVRIVPGATPLGVHEVTVRPAG